MKIRAKPAVFWATVLIIGLLLAFAGGEITVRYFFHDSLVLFPRYHTDARYGEFTIRRIRPNSEFTHTSPDGTFRFKTNNKGFRNGEDVEYSKPPGTLRILALGDSQTQGYEVDQDETFSSVCEQLLRMKGIKSQVLNGGVSGFGTAEELVMLENEGYRYQLDFVVVGFFANDFEDNVKCGLFKLQGDSLVVSSRTHVPGVNIQNRIYSYWIFRYLGENSYLYSLVFNSLWDYFKSRALEEGRQKIADEYAIPLNQMSDYEHRLTVRILERMYKFCRRNSIKLILLDIPQLSTGVHRLRSSVPDECLEEFKENCDVFLWTNDVLSSYDSLAEPHRPHGQRHISAETHALLGKRLGTYIISHR